MPDRVKYIKIVFDDLGRIVREYKSVHFEGEGAPRDVEIDPVERFALVGSAQAIGVKAVSEMHIARTKAEAEAEHTKTLLEKSEDRNQTLQNDLNAAEAQLKTKTAALEAAEALIAVPTPVPG